MAADAGDGGGRPVRTRDEVSVSGRLPVDRGDILSHSLKEASCAPLELAAAAFAELGSLCARPNLDCFMPHLVLTANLKEVDTAMRRPGLLQRADEMVPCATGHVLAAMASAVQDQVDGFMTIAAPTVAGVLHLVRFGATLATTEPAALTTHLIDACAALARAHLQLPASDRCMLCQADEDMLQSLEYLQATIEFAAHTQALTEKEHRLLDKSAGPLEAQDSPLDQAADAADHPCTLQSTCQAQANLLDAAWIIVQRRLERRLCPAVPPEIANAIVQIYSRVADFNKNVPAPSARQHLGVLSDGRPLLEAAAPAASARVKAAAVVLMGNRLTAALTPSGALDATLDDAHLLPWRALHLMAYMAALDALCGATSATDLLGDCALLLAWRASAVTLRHCCKILINEQDRSRIGTERAVPMRAWERLSDPRFPRSSIFDDISQAIAKAIQLTWGTVKQLLANDNDLVVIATLGIIQRSKINVAIVQMWRLPLCSFATPDTWSGKCEAMFLLCSFWQMADMHMCFMRVPTLLKAKGQSVSAEDFQMAVQSGTQFVDMMTKVDSVAECAVPPGGPSMMDTALKGITELGRLAQSGAPQWPQVCMDEKLAILLKNAMKCVAEMETTAEVCDVVDCCKCLCSALRATAQACYGPCAHAKSGSDLVFGMPAIDAVMEGVTLSYQIEDLKKGLSGDLAAQLHGHLEKVQLAIANTQPHDSTRFGKELWRYWVTSLASEVSAGRLATSDLETLADIDASFAAGPAAGQRRTPSAMRAQLSSKHQQQQAAAASATPAASREMAKPAAPPQLSSEQQQRVVAAASAAAAAADHMALLLMEEEAAESTAKGAKQARKKGQKSKKSAKRAAKAAAPSPADLADATPEAAAAEQPVDRHAASGSRTQPGAHARSGSDANAGAEVQPPAGSKADNTWQLCALTKVRMKDPVIASDGVCYERAALEGWLAAHGAVSPTTKEAIRADFVPNHMLRSLLQAL